MEGEGFFMPRLLNMHNSTSAIFYWAKPVTRAAQIQSVGKSTVSCWEKLHDSVAIFNLSDQAKLSTHGN